MKHSRSIPTSHLLILLITIALGSFLRFHKLTYQSLWIDELASWSHSHYPQPYDVITQAVKPDLHPPGYHLLLHYSIRLIGDSESALRLPSVIAGILAIPALYFLTRRLFNSTTGLISAALLAISWAPLYYSQEARAYSFLLLTSIISTHSLIHLTTHLKTHHSLSGLSTAIFILSSTLGSYLHYYGFLLTSLHFLAATLYLPLTLSLLPSLLLPFLAVASLHLPWFDIAIYQFTHNRDKISWISLPTPIIFPRFAKFLFNQSSRLVLLLSPFFLFFFARWVYHLVHHPHTIFRHKSTFLLLWLTAPILIAYTLSYLLTPALALRNLIISAPAAYIILARTLTLLPLPSRILTPLSLFIPSLILYHLLFHQDYYTRLVKEEYRHTAAYIIKRYPDYPNSIIISYTGNPQHYHYYFRHFHSPLTITQNATTLADLPSIQSTITSLNPDYIFLLRAHRIPDPQFLHYFTQNFRLLDQISYGGAAVWLFQTPPFQTSQL